MSLAPPDDAVPLLVGAGQEARDVDEGEDGDVEGVAGAHEAGGLLRGVDVEGARKLHRVVRDDADRAPLDPAEPHHHVGREEWLDLEELAVVEHRLDDGVHVVGDVGGVRDERVEGPVDVIDVEVEFLPEDRRVLEVVLGR